MISADVRANFDIFRECLSGRLIERVIQQPKKPKSKRPQKSDRPAQDTLGVNGSRDEINGGLDTETKPEELAEFTEVFPPEMHGLRLGLMGLSAVYRHRDLRVLPTRTAVHLVLWCPERPLHRRDL